MRVAPAPTVLFDLDSDSPAFRPIQRRKDWGWIEQEPEGLTLSASVVRRMAHSAGARVGCARQSLGEEEVM